MTNNRWIISFESPEASSDLSSTALVGGKGANLARMVQAGFPVPGGFVISTLAYQYFVSENQLETKIQEACTSPKGGIDDPERLEHVSAKIRAFFSEGNLPYDLRKGIFEAYQAMGCIPVAVRSSATAEDLPEMSFAGQQDTFLNVAGENELFRAIVDCWSSLWSARAIGYRLRNQVDDKTIALAVVIQRMVESEVSGVLFTANPLTGSRRETVIDATIGLGEALVSGLVEPDHYLVDIRERRITTKNLGAKALSIHARPGGGTITREAVRTNGVDLHFNVENPEATGGESHFIDRKNQQALTDSQILVLADLGQRVAKYYGTPQDIEWALAKEQIYLLQTRPVTSLFPVPDGFAPDPLEVFMSFGAIQGMLDPITPIGRDALRVVFAMATRLFGYHYQADTQRILASGGERLWVNITPLMRNTVGRKITRGALSFGEPTIQQALSEIWDDRDLLPERKGLQPRAMLRIGQFFLPFIWNVLLNLRSPGKRRAKIVEESELLLVVLKQRCEAVSGDARERLIDQAGILNAFTKENLPHTFLRYVSLIASGMASFNLLRILALRLPEQLRGRMSGDWPEVVLEIVRGLPNNPTTEMDLALWDLARQVRSSEALSRYFQQPAQILAEHYRLKTMPPAASELIDPFLDRYGGRGFAEIDMGRPRWVEDPQHIFEMLSGYMLIRDDHQAPDKVFARGAASAQDAINRICDGLRQQRGGRFKAHAARAAADRVRNLIGARESPKFFAVRMMSILRYKLLETGRMLAEEDLLERADDLLFLSFSEMGAFAGDETRDWKGLIAQRRKNYQREMLRRQVPRLLLSDGRAFYEGMRSSTASEHTLTGSPVSPGTVEGRVRVVVDPRRAMLQPGEIMVCPGTDPSWTPLFLTAAGLVMEVGGMMTHGAVVAREYGIPAVVGVDQATKRLVDGQRIRVDGSSGMIALLEETGE